MKYEEDGETAKQVNYRLVKETVKTNLEYVKCFLINQLIKFWFMEHHKVKYEEDGETGKQVN